MISCCLEHEWREKDYINRSVKLLPDSFHSRTVRLDIIKVFYLSTDAQENFLKKSVKIYIKTAPTCFGAITIIRGRII
jgi:hypothetical protein